MSLIENVQTVFVTNANCEMPYSHFVEKLFKLDTDQVEFCHIAMGVSGEAGELTDALKKHAIYGKELDRTNVIEELGDLRFYMQALMNKLQILESEILQHNADKLGKRYPKGTYSNQDAIARADKVEHTIEVNGQQVVLKELAPPAGISEPKEPEIDIHNISDWFPTGYPKVFFSPSKTCYVYNGLDNKYHGPFFSISNAKQALDDHETTY